MQCLATVAAKGGCLLPIHLYLLTRPISLIPPSSIGLFQLLYICVAQNYRII